MSYYLSFELPFLPKSTNANAGIHWRNKSRHANVIKQSVIMEAHGKTPKAPLKKAILQLTRVSTKRPDYDGLVSSFKHVIDGLIHAHVIENDNFEVIGIPEYLWEPGKRGQGYIKVRVWEHADTKLFTGKSLSFGWPVLQDSIASLITTHVGALLESIIARERRSV